MNFQPPEEDDPRDDDQLQQAAEALTMSTTTIPAGADMPQGALTDEQIAALLVTTFNGEVVPQVWFKRSDVFRAIRAALAARPGATAAAGVPTPAQGRMLAQALGECLIASGIVRKDASLSGPELLMFAEDLKAHLAAQTETQPASDAVLARVEHLEQVFQSCVIGMVSEDYAQGYREGLDHVRRAFEPPCKWCGGTGIDGDVDDRGGVIDVPCSCTALAGADLPQRALPAPKEFLCRVWGEDIDHTLTAIVPDWDGVRRFCVEFWTGGEDATDYDGSLTLNNIKREFDEHEADGRGEFTHAWEIGGVSIERICNVSAALAAQTETQPASEAVTYQYRWFDSNAQAWQEWEPLEVINRYTQTMEQRIAEVESYRYAGKQIYEVRALGVIATPAQPAPAPGAGKGKP